MAIDRAKFDSLPLAVLEELKQTVRIALYISDAISVNRFLKQLFAETDNNGGFW